MDEAPSAAWFARMGVRLLEWGEVPSIAMERPADELLVARLQALLGRRIQPVLLSASIANTHLETDNAWEDEAWEKGLSEACDEKNGWETAPVVQLVQNLVQSAFQDGATDIHVEPEEASLKIRFRKDGMLVPRQTLPIWVKDPVVARLKIMAGLDIAEKRVPQDGRFSWTYRGSEADVRVSTLPTRYGEKAVLRLLRRMPTIADIAQLGMPDSMLATVQSYFAAPQGVFFVTGPTGSGKTSTLYAGLQGLLKRQINITTLEDPIEFDLPGANQVQINEKAGLGFAEALRSLLRQDPDVILVGEIRDGETARIAVQAAQTGHLVLATMHTNDSYTAITRLCDLGVEPYLVGHAVLGVLSQRLVRRVCEKCMQWGPLDETLRSRVPGMVDMVPHAVGCPACDGLGYKGRVAIFGMLPMDNSVRDCILANEGEAVLREHPSRVDLWTDGCRKVSCGMTTPEELVRVLPFYSSLA